MTLAASRLFTLSKDPRLATLRLKEIKNILWISFSRRLSLYMKSKYWDIHRPKALTHTWNTAWLAVVCYTIWLIISRPGPSVRYCNAPCPSVTFSFRTVTRKRIDVFLCSARDGRYCNAPCPSVHLSVRHV